jgi:putative transcriptional regulator
LLLFFHDLHTEKKQVVKNTIKIQRATNDLTQESLANKIGVSRQTINSIEKNRYIPSTILALKLSKLFNKGVNELFELEDED